MQAAQSKRASTLSISPAIQLIGLALLGTLVFLIAGFVPVDLLHSVTHDMRHALGLPCH